MNIAKLNEHPDPRCRVMDADDPRHGTVAGYRAHYDDSGDRKPCEPCREAKRAWTRANPKKRAVNYATNGGYDPADGLPPGRWMRDTWGVVRYVEIATETPKPPRVCFDCGQEVPPRFQRCETCRADRKRARNRDNMARLRAA